MKFRRGDMIADKYRVVDRLGEGGMGEVLLAHHELLGRPVAVKVLHTQADDPNQRERFLREGRIMAQVTSAHAVRLNDVGQLPSGQLFLVMERLEGKDLATTVDREGPLPVPVAVDVVLQTLDALAEAHSLGIVHRDLKPANIFLTRDPSGRMLVKVLDFGISKTLKEEVALTSTGAVMGSPLYMAPEQVRSAKAVHVETDIWALGVVLFETLTGRAPFNGNTAGEVFASILDGVIPPIQQLRPDVPPGLAQIIARCLSKKTTDRFPSCGELAQALAPFGTGQCNANVARAIGYAPQRQATAMLHAAQPSPITNVTLPLSAMQSGPHEASANASTQQSWTEAGRKSGATPGARPRSMKLLMIAVSAMAILAMASMGAYIFKLRQAKDMPKLDPATTAATAPLPAVSSVPAPSASAVAAAPTPATSESAASSASAPLPAPTAPVATTQPVPPRQQRPRGAKKLGDTSSTRD